MLGNTVQMSKIQKTYRIEKNMNCVTLKEEEIQLSNNAVPLSQKKYLQ